MDPQANLAEQERLLEARAAYAAKGGRPSPEERHDAARLKELRYALKGWLARGGFAPAWERCPLAAAYFVDECGFLRRAFFAARLVEQIRRAQ